MALIPVLREERRRIKAFREAQGFYTCAKCGRLHGMRILRCWRCGYTKPNSKGDKG